MYGQNRDLFTLFFSRPAMAGLVFFLAAVAFSGPVGRCQAGTFHERFAQTLNKTAPDAKVSGLITLAEQIDFAELEREMSDRGLHTRAERHEFVLRRAKELARRSQKSILRELAAEKLTGRVRTFKAFWVSNTLAVEADPAVFLRLSLRGDVGVIYPNDPLTLRIGTDDPVPPGSTSVPTREANTLLPGLLAVNVQSAWDRGYTGAGRLVCDFDTGADGDHPAYGSRWRGLDPGVEWYHAWKDPYQNTQFPWDSGSHGTHTLGIMVGHPPGEDPIGVAYEAKWIAAGILINYDVQRIIECYEWAADPDGDPSTLEDVPDVINNSWGTSGDCDQTYWNAIDLVEAAGIVNTIAVDNSGPGYASVNSPESRATTPYQNFGVGNINPHDPSFPIATNSGRGPSPCDMSSIKPEMTAPGTSIYSTIPNDSYGLKSGTSMACPHVSGAVVILRQVNPELTVEQIKDALMQTAYDRGDPGEDNTYGWGVLDVGAAVDYVLLHHPPAPAPRNLQAVEPAENVIQLIWEEPQGVSPTNPLEAYNVYRAAGDEPYPPDPVATIPAGVTGYEDEGRPDGSYRYVVTAVYQNGAESDPSNEVIVVISDISAAPEHLGKETAARAEVWPNPFSSGLQIRLAHAGAVPPPARVIDTAGRQVRSLIWNADASSAEAQARWDGRDDLGRRLPAGTYYVVVALGDRSSTHRVVLLP